MKTIEHEIKIAGNAHEVYQALTSRDGLQAWHSAHIEGKFNLNDEFSVIHEDHPSFTWKIIGLKPDQSVTWECIKGPGDAPGSQVEFKLSSTDDDRVLLECMHEGWAESSDNFRKCNTLWGMLLDHLKVYIETGTTQPTFN